MNIKVNELRIGNLVTESLGEILRIVSLSIDNNIQNICARGKNAAIWGMSGLNPIPLTTEILEKCGFKFDKNRPYDMNNYGVDMDEKNLHFYYDSITLNFNGFGNVQYVHQLQNLYFALTGEELTINP